MKRTIQFRKRVDFTMICTNINIDWKDIKTPIDLFNILKKDIDFPEYFWNNWDSFWDIINDKEFIKKDICISIYDLETMFIEWKDRKIFKNMLLDWVASESITVDIEISIIT
jgi:RNAse (barnase) inhibitor barstar